MFRLIYRQRRRLLFGWFFFTLTVLTMFLREGYGPDYVANPWLYWPFITLAAMALTAAVFVPVALFIVVAPRWRFIVEFAFFLTFLIYTLDIESRIATAIGLPDDYLFLIFFAVYFVVFSLTYGVWLDRFRLGLDYHATRHFRLPLSPDEVWPAFSIADGGPERNWEQKLRGSVRSGTDPNVYDVRYVQGPSVFQHQTQTVLAARAPHHYRYSFFGDTTRGNRALTQGELELHLEPDGDGASRGTLRISRNALLPRQALQMWFDDEVGDKLDSFLTRTRGRRDWCMAGLEYRKIKSLS